MHNRSDAFAGEDMQNEVKSQHMERAIKFLVNELNVCSNRAEAEDRIYFISAKEALQARMQEAKGQPPQISTEDFFPRYLEFQKFEREFTACLSQSAVQTKFSAHSKKGQYKWSSCSRRDFLQHYQQRVSSNLPWCMEAKGMN